MFDKTFYSMERSVVHGSTFGGNDFAAGAGLASLMVIEQEPWSSAPDALGELLMELTLPLKERFEIVHDVRGLGLIWGLELGPPSGRAARRVWEAIERRQPGLFAQMVTVPLFREHHILTQVAGHHMNIVKALPPLTIPEEDLRRFVSALEHVLSDVESGLLRGYASLGMNSAAACCSRAEQADLAPPIGALRMCAQSVTWCDDSATSSNIRADLKADDASRSQRPHGDRRHSLVTRRHTLGTCAHGVLEGGAGPDACDLGPAATRDRLQPGTGWEP